MESECIWTNDVTITKATVTYIGSGTQMVFYIGTSNTIDGTYTYEGPVTNGTIWNFTTTGKFIKYKCAGIDYTITDLNIQINA